jgi:hypothetical protein
MITIAPNASITNEKIQKRGGLMGGWKIGRVEEGKDGRAEEGKAGRVEWWKSGRTGE